MQCGLLLLIFHESKPATCLLSPEFNMLPPEEGTEKSQGQQPKYRQCPYATYTPVSSSRYRSQLLRKVLIGFWTMKSGSVIFHWLRSTLPQLASPALYFRALILVKYILWASWFYLGLFSRRAWLDTWLEDMRRGEVRVFLPSLSLLPVASLAPSGAPAVTRPPFPWVPVSREQPPLWLPVFVYLAAGWECLLTVSNFQLPVCSFGFLKRHIFLLSFVILNLLYWMNPGVLLARLDSVYVMWAPIDSAN